MYTFVDKSTYILITYVQGSHQTEVALRPWWSMEQIET